MRAPKNPALLADIVDRAIRDGEAVAQVRRPSQARTLRTEFYYYRAWLREMKPDSISRLDAERIRVRIDGTRVRFIDAAREAHITLEAPHD